MTMSPRRAFFPYDEAIALTEWDKTRDVIGRARDIVQAFTAPQSGA